MLSSDAALIEIPIQRSEARNKYKEFGPGNAHDGKYETIYHANDGSRENYLKLYLAKTYSIAEVKVVNRLGGWQDRIVGLVIKVYSTTEGDDKEVELCGKISGRYVGAGSLRRWFT